MLNLFSQRYQYAPVAQLDRVRGYEPRGREFESLRARHKNNHLQPFEKFHPPTETQSSHWNMKIKTMARIGVKLVDD